MASPWDTSLSFGTLVPPIFHGPFVSEVFGTHAGIIIIFSTLWGIALREWKGAELRTRMRVTCTLRVLVGSTTIVDRGNYFGVAQGKLSASVTGEVR